MNVVSLVRRVLRRATRGMSPGRAVLLSLAAVLTTAGVAMAVAVGLQNAGFENPLGADNWTASTFRDGAYQPSNCPTPSDQATSEDEVCRISGDDTFTVRDSIYATPRSVSVSPIEGSHMVRLGGPFNDNEQRQDEDHAHVVEQTFQVPNTADAHIDLSYNVYTFDYTGYDNFGVRLQLTDASGTVLNEENHGSFGPGGDTSLKTTGWRPLHFDLSGLQGQTVHLKFSSVGTRDTLYGFWVYLDGPGAVDGPVDGAATQPHPPTDPATGKAATVETYSDPANGQTFINVPQGTVNHFPGHCMPLAVTVPIHPGSGTVSNAALTLKDSGGVKHVYPLTAGVGGYSATIDCVQDGALFVDYDLTEGSTTQHFTVPIGGLTLIDPSGTVVDNASGNAVSGAAVRLYRKSGGSYSNVLSGDPGIAPHVNPETTGADGKWGWDVSAGTYRVVVLKAGYNTLTSQDFVVSDGHPVTGVVLRLVKPSAPKPPVDNPGGDKPGGGGGGNPGGGNPGGGNPPPPPPPPVKAACAGKHGTALSTCKALIKCNKKHGKAKKVCVAQVKAIAKCQKIGKKKKRAACIKRAHQIGHKKHGHKKH
jgi:hypothetical protein